MHRNVGFYHSYFLFHVFQIASNNNNNNFNNNNNNLFINIFQTSCYLQVNSNFKISKAQKVIIIIIIIIIISYILSYHGYYN